IKERENSNSTEEPSNFMTPKSNSSEQFSPKEVNREGTLEKDNFYSFRQISNNNEINGLGIISQGLIETSLSEKKIIEKIISDLGLSLKKNSSLEQLVDFIRELINPPFMSNLGNK